MTPVSSSAQDGESQRQLVQRIAGVLITGAQPGWQRLRVECAATGRHVEVEVLVTGRDGDVRQEPPPQPVPRLFEALRAAMYEPGLGMWHSAALVVVPADPPQIEITFAAGLRTPRVFDGVDESGRPVVDRAPLAPAERENVLGYLSAAPVVLAARGHAADVFGANRPSAVPLNFRTDGTWVWPGAVAYYLKEHNIAPDPPLLKHIRAREFVVPPVGDAVRGHAVTTITDLPSTTDMQVVR